MRSGSAKHPGGPKTHLLGSYGARAGPPPKDSTKGASYGARAGPPPREPALGASYGARAGPKPPVKDLEIKLTGNYVDESRLAAECMAPGTRFSAQQ